MWSQGVFGFINSERVNLALEFTHDPVVAIKSDPSCADSPGASGFTGQGGAPLSCADLAEHCSHRQHGPAIQRGCKGPFAATQQ